MLFNICRFCENKLCEGHLLSPPRRYHYFDVVVGFAWSNGPESCAGGSVVFRLGIGCVANNSTT
jgi:hypothetical protein